MADNVTVDNGSLTDYAVASDDDGTAQHQYVKLEFGADGVFTKVSTTDRLPTVDAGDVAHDAADSGNPVKVGAKAASALPTAVADADRANLLADLWGRQLVAAIDPAMQTWKSYNGTATVTGGTIWDPTSGKKIAVTHLVVSAYATTAGRLILWFGDAGDATYTEGTDQPLFKGSFAPGTSVKPGAVVPFDPPAFCKTANRELHITTDAALSVDVVAYGYEW